MVRLLLPLAVLLAAAACGDKKPAPKKPVVKKQEPPTAEPKRETEEDREKQRREQALSIIPDGTTCFPPSLKVPNGPRLEMAAIGADAVICANDTDRERLLGPIACWKVDLAEGGLIYQAAAPLPGRSIAVKLEDRCARGFCLPKEAKLPDDKIAYVAWNEDGSKAVMLAGDEVHLFDATARARESGFGIRGEKGVTNTPDAIYWLGDTLFIHGVDAGPASYVFVFKLDGTAVGPVTHAGGKDMVSTAGGGLVMLDRNRVGVVEKGFSQVTVYEADSGKRSKIARTVSKGPCKQPEIDSFWADGEVPAKCKEHLNKQYGHLIGADAVAGKTNLLVLLRGPRLGELAVLDVKTLAEKKNFKLPWCEGATAGAPAADGEAKEERKTRAPAKKEKPKAAPASSKGGGEEDPDAGGQ
jgi:hypothetical protein